MASPIGSQNPYYTMIAARKYGLGRVVATFDRNTFFNPPGLGTNISNDSNSYYAINLFMWVAGY